jgi:Domain of unknown function (DUF5666)
MSMPATSVNPRLARLALGAVAVVIILSVAMCHSSDTNTSNSAKPAVPAAAPPPPPPSVAPPPAPPPVGKDYVEGLVESVSGGTIQLRTRTGSATVDFGPPTRIVEVSPAKLSDVTPGSCVNVRGTPQSAPSGGAVTAQSVTITSAVDGKCPPPAGFYGTVTSVSGDTIAVTGIGAQAAPTSVTVANSTSYQLQTPADAQAIANGKCLGAQGIQDAGVLHATTISLQTCPPMGHPHHHLHLPHLPFHL